MNQMWNVANLDLSAHKEVDDFNIQNKVPHGDKKKKLLKTVILQRMITAVSKPPFLLLFNPLREEMVLFCPLLWNRGVHRCYPLLPAVL